MYKFKIGDRVRNLESNGFVKQGATGTVDENESVCPWIAWDSEEMIEDAASVCNNLRWSQDQNYLELIEESPLAEVAEAAKQYIEDTKTIGSSGEFPKWQEPHIQQQPQESAPLYGGKTEEEWLWIFAGQAMEGCISAYAGAANWPNPEDLNKRVLMYSKALIEELKKQKQ